MKELKEIKPIYLEEYDINVKPYLTYAQIQNIANQALKCKDWAHRNSTIDYMMLSYATDISEKELNDLGQDYFIMSGIVEQVRNNISNFCDVYDAISEEENAIHLLAKIIDDIVPTFEKKLKEYGKRNK